MKRNFRRSYRKKRIKPLFYSRFFWLPILVLLSAAGIFYMISFHSFFQVREINISGNKKVSLERIETAVTAEVEKKVLFFPSRSIFFVDFGEIKKQILNSFPQVGRVNINRNLPHTLNIVVAEKSGRAVWHQDNKYYLLDENGIIFEEVPGEQEGMFTIQSSITDSEPILGANAIPKERLAQILAIEKRLPEADVLLEEALIVSPERLDIKTVAGWEIYFNIQEDIDWQLTEFVALLEKYISPEDRENLKYVDLRFEKVYYKFKNE